MAEPIPFCSESIVDGIFTKLAKDSNKENQENQENGMKCDRSASKSDILQELNLNVSRVWLIWG